MPVVAGVSTGRVGEGLGFDKICVVNSLEQFGNLLPVGSHLLKMSRVNPWSCEPILGSGGKLEVTWQFVWSTPSREGDVLPC